jgi:hypothetical protein
MLLPKHFVEIEGLNRGMQLIRALYEGAYGLLFGVYLIAQHGVESTQTDKISRRK